MQKKISASVLILITAFGISPIYAGTSYWLVIGSYRQGPGGKPHVSGITSPSLLAIPMKNKKACQEAGQKIEEEIYKPVWQFDNRWTCIFNGIN
tara:strand:+ start:72 stop:353 length:282 start_codon:yes stop_codon:yes gene_type:complete